MTERYSTIEFILFQLFPSPSRAQKLAETNGLSPKFHSSSNNMASNSKPSAALSFTELYPELASRAPLMQVHSMKELESQRFTHGLRLLSSYSKLCLTAFECAKRATIHCRYRWMVPKLEFTGGVMCVYEQGEHNHDVKGVAGELVGDSKQAAVGQAVPASRISNGSIGPASSNIGCGGGDGRNFTLVNLQPRLKAIGEQLGLSHESDE